MASKKKPVSKQLATLKSTEQLESSSMVEALLGGDLGKLSDPQLLSYYNELCKSLSLNPLTKPFIFIRDKEDRLIMYASKACTEQLRQIHNLNIVITSREKLDGVYMVIAKAKDKHGREDEAIGVAALEKEEINWVWNEASKKKTPQRTGKTIALRGEELANAMMKAETKAKRRVTLSIAGLGAFDDDGTNEEPIRGEVLDAPKTEPGTPEEMQATIVSVNEQQLIQDKERAEKLGIDPSLMEDMAVTKTPVNPPAKIIEAELVPANENTISVGNMQYDYRDVVCHIGTASGPCLGKTVGDCVRKLENDIKSPEVWKWLVKKISSKGEPVGKDRILLLACQKALYTIEIKQDGTQQPHKAPPEPEKVTPQPNNQPEAVKVTDWRTEIIDIEVPSIKGKAFGELNDKWLNAIKSNILDDPEKSKLATPRFKAVYALARDGAGLDCTLSEIQEMIKTYFDNLLLTEADGIKHLQKLELVPADLDTLPDIPPGIKDIKDIEETLLRYIYRNWPDTREALKSELEPKAKAPVKKAKKK